MADSRSGKSSEAAFFALVRDERSEGTSVESGSRLGDLRHNSILKAMAELHEHEEAAFSAGEQE